MALSKEDLDQIVSALAASGAVVQPPPPEPAVHPAAAQVTPVESLLGMLRLQPAPDTLATVNQWLVDQGYEQPPEEREPEPGTPEAYQKWLKAQEKKPAPEPEPVDPDRTRYEAWIAEQGASSAAPAATDPGAVPGT